jgi:hypothetical protein
MNILFSVLDRFSVGPPGRRTRAPVIHPIDAMMWLECSLSHGIALAKENSPWEFLPNPDTVPPGLYEPFRAGTLLRDYSGELASVFDLFADAAPSAYRRGNREYLLMLMRQLGADAFVVNGDGIAVSNPRHLLVLPVPEPIISICLACVPVLLGADGSVPVHVFLSVVSPTVETQLAVLARLSRLIARDGFLQAIEGPNPHDDVMDFVWLHDCGLAGEQIDVPAEWS